MVIAVVAIMVAIGSAYEVWRLIFRYQEEVRRLGHYTSGARHTLLLEGHGHVGVAYCLAVGTLFLFVAVNGVWRFWTRYPAAILLPDRLWLHPSFGKQPIPYSNVVSVQLRYIYGRRQVGLVIDFEKPAKLNWVFWAYLPSRRQIVIRSLIIGASLYDLARFRDRLATSAAAARLNLHKLSAS